MNEETTTENKNVEIRRGPTVRCKEKICNQGNPKKKDLIEMETMKGTICKHCFCVQEWEKNIEEQSIEIELNPTEKEEKIRTDKLVAEAKKRPKKKYNKQVGLDFEKE